MAGRALEHPGARLPRRLPVLRDRISEAIAVLQEDISHGRLPGQGEGYSPYVDAGGEVHALTTWYRDEVLGGLCSHESRSHMEGDLRRYLYCSAFAQLHDRSPKLNEFPAGLLPDHKNVQAGINSNHFSDRFRVQVEDRPASTVTSHIAKDGHYFIHYDPAPCRSLSVREAARLQTFPDNYYFEGNSISSTTKWGMRFHLGSQCRLRRLSPML